ncbi:hypothetical protein BJX64DRAFT_295002 [Aspergillus heterothallicus]
MAASSNYTGYSGYSNASHRSSESQRPSGGGFVEGTVVSAASGYSQASRTTQGQGQGYDDRYSQTQSYGNGHGHSQRQSQGTDMRRTAMQNAQYNQDASRGSLYEQDARDREALAARRPTVSNGARWRDGDGDDGLSGYGDDSQSRYTDDARSVYSGVSTVRPNVRPGNSRSENSRAARGAQQQQYGMGPRGGSEYGSGYSGYDDDARTVLPEDSISQVGGRRY